MTTTAHVPTIDSVLNSPLWHRREGARRTHMAAWVDFLWYRSIWRNNRTPQNRAACEAAETAYWETMRLTNHLDGYVWSHLIARGVDVDQLPADCDECPRCRGEIRENFGCACTNVVLALELG
ncbi:hypothetical protein ACWFMI_25095 [Nocardiopsis terrae]|uniref:hypothetical protein n=1 Tax=Streptomyces sp. NPDC057554 TaxID=3350538 RepID=UPI0036850E2B